MQKASLRREAWIWILAGVLVLAGVLGWVLRGWQGGASEGSISDGNSFAGTGVLWLAAVLIVALASGERRLVGWLAWAVAGLALAGIGLLQGRAPVTLAVDWVLFMVAGAVVVTAVHRVISRWQDAVTEADEASRALIDERTVLTDRVTLLQEDAEALRRRLVFLEASLSVSRLFPGVLARGGFDLGGLLNRTAEVMTNGAPGRGSVFPMERRLELGSGSAWEGSGSTLEQAHSESPGLPDFDHVMIYLVDYGPDGRGEWATLQAASSVEGKALALRGYRVHREDATPVGWVLAHQTARLSVAGQSWGGAEEAALRYDAAHDGVGSSDGEPKYRTSTPDDLHVSIPALAAMRSWCVLPLMVEGELVGVLDVRSLREAAFEQEDVEILSGLTDPLAVMIHAARRLRDEAAVLDETSPFYRTASRLVMARTESEVYEVMLAALEEAPADWERPMRTLIVRQDAVGDLRVVVDGRQGTHALTQQEHQGPLPLSELRPPSLVDVVLMGTTLARPLWAENLADPEVAVSPELRRAFLELAESSDVAGLAFVPIRWQVGQEAAPRKVTERTELPQSAGPEAHQTAPGPGLGVEEAPAPAGGIVVLYGTQHRFTPLERRLHELLTELGGVALARSRLLTEARTRLEREQLLVGIGERLRTSFDPDVILQTTVRELGRALGAEFTSIELAPGPRDHPTHMVDTGRIRVGEAAGQALFQERNVEDN